MLFNSISFLIFFPAVCCLYFVLPSRWRWLHLLLASCLFYMWFIPYYILILFATILVDYSAGILIDRFSARPQLKRFFLIASIISTCLILAIFKYYNFFISNVNQITESLGWGAEFTRLDILLPIGLSFHTFQSLSYVIEVYRGSQKVERHFGIYALYVMFFPQLVAGPIERPQNILHQFYEHHSFDPRRARDGLLLMAWGFFKKVAVADRLAIMVQFAYGAPASRDGITLLYATIFFAFQIYYDFSGYSDIARGCAQVLGYRLMVNFDRPYASRSIAEFWRRWHISLSSWFRDYLYIPLGGSRTKRFRRYCNLMITFAVSGLWHGANWTFVIWGLLNGMYLVCGDIKTRSSGFIARRTPASAAWLRMPRFALLEGFCRNLIVFVLIDLSWVFFRAASVEDALVILHRIADDCVSGRATAWNMLVQIPLIVFAKENLIPGILGIVLVTGVEWLVDLTKDAPAWRPARWPWFVRHAMYYAICIITLLFGVLGETRFIYFQF